MKEKTDNQKLVEKFVKAESIIWPRETKLIIQLRQQEPLEFWYFLVLAFKLNTLAWFKSAEGKKEIAKQKKIFLQLQTTKAKPVQDNFEYERKTTPKKSLKDRLLK